MAFHLPATEIRHYLMVNVLVDSLRRAGYDEIEADHLVSAPRPQDVLGEHGLSLVPDVVACKDGKKIIFEVKTEEALFAPETEEQLRTFARHAEETGCEFCLLVPERCGPKVKYLLASLGMPELSVLYL
ncbi:MAG: hypothetical protein IH614_00425 [Desulfuromonadales bacterium]|nr:hypothetical protein [Desulfuromonadales bacterium]